MKKTVLGHLLWSICCVSLFTWSTSAQEPGQSNYQEDISFQQLTVNNESFQNQITCITQDKKGYMWFGTWSGLYKYDGLKLTLYKQETYKPKSIRDRKFRKIFEDSKGNLWIGSMYEGLQKYDRNRDEFIQYKNDPNDPNSLSDNDVTEIFEDSRGVLWIGTSNGLNQLIKEIPGKGGTNSKALFKRYKVQNENFAFDRVNIIYQDEKERLWIGGETGLYYLDQHSNKNWPFIKFIVSTNDNYYNENYIYSLIETEGKADETILWIATRAGLKRMIIDNKDHKWAVNFAIKDYGASDKNSAGISNNKVKALHNSSFDKNSIWVGTEDGLNRFDLISGVFHKYKTNFRNPKSISNNFISSIYEDKSGVLWIGTDKGINKLDLYKKRFYHFQVFEKGTYSGLTNNFVNSITTDSDDNLWISTSGGGLNKATIDPNTGFPKNISKISIQEEEFKKFSHNIYTTLVDKSGKVWVCTNGGGIYRFNKEDIRDNKVTKLEHFYSDYRHEILNDDYILSIHEGKNGNIWIGTWGGGLIKYDNQTNKFFQFIKISELPNELWKFPITTIYEDNKGYLWFGTRGGGVYVLRFERNKWKYFSYKTTQDSSSLISNDYVNFIFHDKKENIWIGTEGGLNLFEKGANKFKVLTEKNGLPSDVMQAIAQDEAGNLWISTNKGLSKLMESSGTPDKLISRNYDTEDGLQAEIFNNNSCAQTKAGVIFFGGINGVNAYYPEEITDNNHPPQVEITNFMIFNKQVGIGPDVTGRTILQNSISETQKINLNHNENSISFEFASLHFVSPGKNKYAYRMIGFDKDWIFTEASRNMASYTNLDPGKYTFEVKATNNDDLWSNEVAKVEITIAPPFWKTPVAYIIYTLIILSMLYLLRSWILMRVNFRHNLHLERVKREQVEMLNQLKIKFFTNISHEIRTPLTLIMGSLERTLTLTGLNAKAYNQLLVMQKNGEMMLRLISELLDFRKMESGHLGLKAEQDNIVNFLNGIFVSFKDLAVQRQINFRFEASTNEIDLWYDSDKLEKVIYNLLSNAFKFTKDKGSISLSIKTLEITDALFKKISVDSKIYDTSYIEIRVKDNGIGIPPDQTSKIFDPYYQVETNDPYYQNTGTGIGLSLSKNMVELHKGFIILESAEGKGSSFSVYLPQGEVHLNESERIEGNKLKDNSFSFERDDNNEEVDPISEGMDSKKDLPLILIVEDNADVRTFIKQCFEDEYKLILASNGEEGLKIALEKIPDLIISDVIMPEMDGLELCRKIKTNEKTSHIPFILLTARTSLIYKTEGLETGADDYITKPFNAQILTLKARNLIRLKKSLIEKFANKTYLKPHEIATNSVDEIFLSKAIDIVNTQMHNPDYTTEELGNELAMSRMQLYRKLKALTGLTPVEFIRSQRIQRGAQLLLASQLTIAEITYEIGFTDLKYFRKCFKDYYNVNPSDYINKKK